MTEEQSKVRIGRVYKIIHQTDSNWCYVGSTFNKLHKAVTVERFNTNYN